jgi:hypothetical protein
MVLFGVLRLRLAQTAAPNFAQDDGILYDDSILFGQNSIWIHHLAKPYLSA